MKIKHLQYVLLSLASLHFSCQQKTADKKAIMVDLNIKPVLIAQVEAGNDYDYGGFNDYGEKDLNALVAVEDTILTNNGFKKLDPKSFNQRIKNIFGRVIDPNSKTSYLKVDTYGGNFCNKDLTFVYSSVDNPYIYVAKKKQFITDFKALPEVMDYLKAYPDLSAHEKKDIEFFDEVENIKGRASQWKDDLKSLSEQRRKNIQILVNRNKDLFNDDQASLTWLLKNDQQFLTILLSHFGYDKDTKINKMVLDSIYQVHTGPSAIRGEYIPSLFFVKDCTDKLQIREGLLKYVADHTSARDNRFIYALGDFMYKLCDDTYKDFYDDASQIFTPIEKAKIVAYIANIENPAIEKYKGPESYQVWNNAGSNLYNISQSNPEVIKIIEKNNYFGLPKMKDIIEKLAEEAPAPGGDPE